MSKDIPIEVLIELAKLAPKVEPEIEGPRRQSGPIYNYTLLSDFLSVTNLKAGRNPIKNKEVYNIYSQWAKNPMTGKQFNSALSDHFKKSGKYMYKYNMKLITLEEIVKELKLNEEAIKKK